MRPAHLSSLLLLVCGISAQDYNRVERNNDPYYRGDTANASTGVLGVYKPVNPDAYSDTTTTVGVPAGTLSWRWFPSENNLRRETRQVSGFYIGLRYSYSTPAASLPLTGYVPEISIHKGKPRVGGGVDPDLAQAPLFTLATSSTLFATANSTIIPSRTLSAPVGINETDMVLSCKWQGGEHRDVPGKQCLIGSWFDGDYVPVTTGFASPTNVISYVQGNESCLWLSYMEEQSVILPSSDWGYRRKSANPLPSGYSVSTAQGDFALSTTNGAIFGYDINGGPSMAGNRAVLLFNAGPVFPASFQILGQVLEINVADPYLDLFAQLGYVLTMNPAAPKIGFAAGPRIQVPNLGPSGLGFTFGAEYLVFDPNFTAAVDSTQSAWITLTR